MADVCTPSRAAVFAGTHLNADACAVQRAAGDLLEQLELIAACRDNPDWYAEQWRADLAAAGLDSELTHAEKCDAFKVRTALGAIAATLRLSYEVLAAVARPDVRAAEHDESPLAVG